MLPSLTSLTLAISLLISFGGKKHDTAAAAAAATGLATDRQSNGGISPPWVTVASESREICGILLLALKKSCECDSLQI